MKNSEWTYTSIGGCKTEISLSRNDDHTIIYYKQINSTLAKAKKIITELAINLLKEEIQTNEQDIKKLEE